MYLTFYKSLARPIIEYGNAVWGPHHNLKLKNFVQRQFTKYAFDFNDLHYSECLSVLGLPSL